MSIHLVITASTDHVRIGRRPVAPDEILIYHRGELVGIKRIPVTGIRDINSHLLQPLQAGYVGIDVCASDTIEQLVAFGESVNDIAGEERAILRIVQADPARTMSGQWQHGDFAISEVDLVTVLKRQSTSSR